MKNSLKTIDNKRLRLSDAKSIRRFIMQLIKQSQSADDQDLKRIKMQNELIRTMINVALVNYDEPDERPRDITVTIVN